MSAPTVLAIPWQWPPDVLAFAAEQQADSYLEPLLDVVRRLFPTRRWLRVYVEEDPEIPNERCIVFDVQVAGLSLQEIHERRAEWSREKFRICPVPRVCVFCLCLDVVTS